MWKVGYSGGEPGRNIYMEQGEEKKKKKKEISDQVTWIWR